MSPARSLILALFFASFGEALGGEASDYEEGVDSLNREIEATREALDSLKASTLRPNKRWTPHSQRQRPLLLPRRMISVRPGFHIDIEYYSLYYAAFVYNPVNAYAARIIVAPSNRLNLTVFPYPGISCAVVHNIMEKNRKGVVDGLNVAVFSRILGGELWFTNPCGYTYIQHIHGLRWKWPFGMRSWIDGSVAARLSNQRFKKVALTIKANSEFHRAFCGTVGGHVETGEWSNFFYGRYHLTFVQSVLGFYIVPTRHFSIHFYSRPGYAMQDDAFMMSLGGYLAFEW